MTPGRFFIEEMLGLNIYLDIDPKALVYETFYDYVTYRGFTSDLAKDKVNALLLPSEFRDISRLRMPLFNPEYNVWLSLSKNCYVKN